MRIWNKKFRLGKIEDATVKGVSFAIGRNEILGLMGPSGAGKSSLFKVLTMLKGGVQGNISLLGQRLDSIKSMGILTEGRIGLVFQHDILWEDLTVKEHLELMGRLLLPQD